MNPHDYFDPSKPSHSYDLKRRQAGAFFRKDREQEEQEAILNIRSLTVDAKDATAESRLKEVELRKLELDIEHREYLHSYVVKELELQGVEQRLEAKGLLIEVLQEGLQIESERQKTQGENYVLRAQIEQFKVQVQLAEHNSKLAAFDVLVREKLLEVHEREMNSLNLLNQARLQEKENEIDRKIVFSSQQNQATLEEARKLALEAEYSRKAQGLELREGKLQIGQMQNDLSVREGMLKLDMKGMSLDQKLVEIDKQLVQVKKEQQSVYETYLKARTETEKVQIERHYANLKSDQAVFEQAKIIQVGEVERAKITKELAEVRSVSASERERLTDRVSTAKDYEISNRMQILKEQIQRREDRLEVSTLNKENKAFYEKAKMLKDGAETIYKANQAETRARKAYVEVGKSKVSELNTMQDAKLKVSQEQQKTSLANNRAHQAQNAKHQAEVRANNEILQLKNKLDEKDTQMLDNANYFRSEAQQAREDSRRAMSERDMAERYARDVKRGKI